jgi:hypothetical protein
MVVVNHLVGLMVLLEVLVVGLHEQQLHIQEDLEHLGKEITEVQT